MMSNLPYRSGPVMLVPVPADPAHEIAPGDLVALSGGLARPVSAVPWAGDVNFTRAAAAGALVGVAHAASGAGDAGPVLVDASPLSVYQVPCDPVGFTFGAPVASAKRAGEDALSATRVTAADDAGEACGRAVEAVPAGTTRVRVTFAPAFSTASANAAAAVGG